MKNEFVEQNDADEYNNDEKRSKGFENSGEPGVLILRIKGFKYYFGLSLDDKIEYECGNS